MSIKIALITDTHFDDTSSDHPTRRTAIADILFLRAVHRVNRFIKPDVVLLLGDIVDQGNSSAGLTCLQRMRDLADLIHAPTIAIPGNHDPDPKTFFFVFGRPTPWLDVKGVRFVPLVDVEEPGYNARRTPEGLARMAEACAGFDGPIVAVQHVPLFPPGSSDCPYNYTNAEEAIAAMRANGISVALSGHLHEGMDLVRDEGLSFLAGPGLCEDPFPFLEVTFEGDDVHVRRHELRMPESLHLTDTHIHTQFAYCSENMDIVTALGLAEAFGLAGLRITEHTGQLYFDADTFWTAAFMPDGVRAARPEDRRVEEYIEATRDGGCPESWVGLEVDCDYHGRPVLTEADRAKAHFLNGAMHWLPELNKPEPDLDVAGDEFLATVERFVRSGIDVLAHPFRVFNRVKVAPPARLFEPLVRLLRESGVAAEVNFHSQEPSREFVRLCLDAGVTLSLGSDAHNLYEVGELWPHLCLLEDLGVRGDVKDVLLVP